MDRRGLLACVGAVGGLIGYLEAGAPRYSGDDHWALYGDFVYMGRYELHNTSLVKEDGTTVIDSKQLIQDFNNESGYRVGAFYMPNARYGFEGNFLYITPWEGDKKKKRVSSLSFPFEQEDYDADFTDANNANASYQSEFWTAEGNFWRYFNPRRIDYFALAGLIGVRFFHWDEQFKLQMGNGPADTSSYKIHTQNRIVGLQLGLDFQMHPMRWLTWELLAKGGVFANSAGQNQFLGDDDNSVTLRNSSTQKWQGGWYADVMALMRLECRQWLDVHVGYEALFLTGLALAPEQISRSVGTHAGEHDNTHGNGVIAGLVAGITFHF